MPRVVPSQVCSFIAGLPNYVVTGQMANMNHVGSASLSCVLDLVSQIPDELLTMDNATYGSFVLSKARIQDTLETWLAQRTANAGLHTVQFHTSQDPLALIRNALAQCPDESPAPSTAALAFVSATDLRTNLRNDIGAIYRALSNGEWKATTILAGSAIEALLLWDLQNRPPSEVSAALAKLSTKSVFDKKVPSRTGRCTTTSKCQPK